jgi:hypothetical protein
MDPNLTYPIVLNATINATLAQPPDRLISNPAVTTLLGVVIGWLLNFSTSAIQEKQRLRIDNLQRKKQVYSQLKGIDFACRQTYYAFGETVIISEWLKNRERLGLEELPRFKDKDLSKEISDMLLEIARNDRILWETIGMIQVLFPPSNDLDILLGAINQRNLRIDSVKRKATDTYANAGADKIDSLGDEISGWFRECIEINNPVKDIELYLKKGIDTEEIEINKSRWRTFIQKMYEN